MPVSFSIGPCPDSFRQADRYRHAAYPLDACARGSQEPPGCKHLLLIEVMPLQSCLAMHFDTERPLSDNSFFVLLLLFVSLYKQEGD